MIISKDDKPMFLISISGILGIMVMGIVLFDTWVHSGSWSPTYYRIIYLLFGLAVGIFAVGLQMYLNKPKPFKPALRKGGKFGV